MEMIIGFLNSDAVGAIANLLAIAVLIPLGWDLLRAKFLRAVLDGKKIDVNVDMLKNEYRRNALGEASRKTGKDTRLKDEYKGYKLEITTARK